MEKDIIKIISNLLKINIEELNGNSSIGDFTEWDSMGHLQIYFELESHYNVKINLDMAANARSIKDWANLIEKNENHGK